MPTYASTNANANYAYNDSFLSLTGTLVQALVLNDLSSSGAVTFEDNDGTLQPDESFTVIDASGSAQTATYLGSGTAYTLGLNLFGIEVRLNEKPVMAYEIGGQVYLYTPEGLPILSGIITYFEIDANATFTFDTDPNGIVDGSSTAEVMGVGYTDGDGDQITNGADSIRGNGGDDTISAGDGADTVDGGEDNDVIYGGNGNDVLIGGSGNDILDGEVGSDQLLGGEGDDQLTGGEGDTLTGGAGNDQFVYTGGSVLIDDFGTDDGFLDDGDTTNNDFVDLSGYYDIDAVTLVNARIANPEDQFRNALDLLKADQLDGTLDGVVEGTDYSDIIGSIDLTLQSGGSAVVSASLTNDNTGVICFVRGTLISTQRGQIPVEELTCADKVQTMDNGMRPIRWIGHRSVSGRGALAPIRITKGALTNDRDILLSPNHRVWLRDTQSGLYMGTEEVLVSAKHLTGAKGVEVAPCDTVEYFHLLFDNHEVIFAEGMPSESLHPGKQTWGTFGDAARAQILEIFPELNAEQVTETYGVTARPCARSYEGRMIGQMVMQRR